MRLLRLSHGASSTPEFAIWKGIKDRCLRPGSNSFARYGGRGIRICTRWLRFANFFADMGPRPSRTHSIDRKDRNGHYEPGNCRWATPLEQARNTSRNRYLTISGATRCISEWASISGVGTSTIWTRLQLGWEPARAVFEPPLPIAEACRRIQPLGVAAQRRARIGRDKSAT